MTQGPNFLSFPDDVYEAYYRMELASAFKLIFSEENVSRPVIANSKFA